ncbi:MAG: amidohydrolase [Synechococcaceae cyanobacterium SM2_3_1]|nr:amidohydrolase [Synechococcaceae cyanobacterium SM2_3_1]
MPQLLLTADFILTMDPQLTVLEQGGILVQDDRIAALGSAQDLKVQLPQVPVKHLPHHLIMPGLINTHCHSGLLRGTAEGLPLWDWLRLYIDPMHRVLTPREAEVASWLCYAESLLAGTTTVVDMWRFMDGSARVAAALGNRVVMVPYVGSHPDFNYFDSLDDNEALIQTWKGAAQGRIMPWVGMEHLFYFDEPAYARALEMAQTYGVGLHTHCGETRAEVAETLKRYGLRPVQVLERLGLLDLKTVLLAHCVWVDEAEQAILAKQQVGVAHNPSSNMKLASGAAPVRAMLAAGIAVGLGSDGEKENNNLDLLEEMKVASLLARLREMDAAALSSWEILRMATSLGAQAIGCDAEIGSLEVGKKADLIAVRLHTPHFQPILGGGHFNLHHNLVHAAQGGDVDLTLCDGRILVEEGCLRTAEMEEIYAEVAAVIPDLFARRAAWLQAHPQGAISPV